MRSAAWFRLASIVALVLSTVLVSGAGAQEPDDRPALVPWALEGTGVRSLALAPDGDTLAGTMNGLWRIAPDAKGATPYPAAGLPEPCRALDGQTPGRCSVGWVAVAPNGDVYAVIGDIAVSPNAGGVGYVGLFRNPADSDSWSLVAAPADLEVRRPNAFWVDQIVAAIRLRGLAIGPDGAVSVIASANDGYQPTPRDCVHRSADDGVSWVPVFCGSGEINEIDRIAIGPDGRGWLNGGYFYFVPGRFTITSPNGVDDWEERGIDPSADGGDRGHNIAGFAFDAQGRTYVTTEPGATPGTEGYPLGVYRTADAGLSWERLTPEGLPLGLNAIAVSADGEIFYGSDGSILSSSDEGQAWTDRFQPVERITALQIGQDGSLWVATEAALYRSPGPATDGPVGIPPMPGATAGAPDQAPALPEPAPAGGDQVTGIDDARAACDASGGTFTVLPDGGYECIHGPGGAIATAAPEATATPAGTAAPDATAAPAATTAPPAATAIATATSVPVAEPTTAPPSTATAEPQATSVPPATAAPPSATATAMATTTSAPPAGNPRDEARRKCFENGGEFWERPNGDFGCRRPGSAGTATGQPGSTTGQPGSTTGQPGSTTGQPGPPCAPCPPGIGGAPVIFSLGSFASRVNGPIAPTQFTLDGEYVIERIQTWHIQGSPMTGSGTIALRGDDGTLYGPWPAKAPTDRGRNTVWEVTPNVTLGAGVYTIIDSDPDTWSQNADTDGRGMAAVYGRPAGSP